MAHRKPTPRGLTRGQYQIDSFTLSAPSCCHSERHPARVPTKFRKRKNARRPKSPRPRRPSQGGPQDTDSATSTTAVKAVHTEKRPRKVGNNQSAL
jgi:hypothetical protein